MRNLLKSSFLVLSLISVGCQPQQSTTTTRNKTATTSTPANTTMSQTTQKTQSSNAQSNTQADDSNGATATPYDSQLVSSPNTGNTNSSSSSGNVDGEDQKAGAGGMGQTTGDTQKIVIKGASTSPEATGNAATIVFDHADDSEEEDVTSIAHKIGDQAKFGVTGIEFKIIGGNNISDTVFQKTEYELCVKLDASSFVCEDFDVNGDETHRNFLQIAAIPVNNMAHTVTLKIAIKEEKFLEQTFTITEEDFVGTEPTKELTLEGQKNGSWGTTEIKAKVTIGWGDESSLVMGAKSEERDVSGACAESVAAGAAAGSVFFGVGAVAGAVYNVVTNCQ